jgi:TusA-related sulfurtransferase
MELKDAIRNLNDNEVIIVEMRRTTWRNKVKWFLNNSHKYIYTAKIVETTVQKGITKYIVE